MRCLCSHTHFIILLNIYYRNLNAEHTHTQWARQAADCVRRVLTPLCLIVHRSLWPTIHRESVLDSLHTRLCTRNFHSRFTIISNDFFVYSRFDLAIVALRFSQTQIERERERERENSLGGSAHKKKMSFKTKTDGWINEKKTVLIIKTNEINTNGKKTFAQFQWNFTTKVIQRKSNNNENRKKNNTNWVVNGINSSCECASIYSNRHILWRERKREWQKTAAFFLLLLQRIDSD